MNIGQKVAADIMDEACLPEVLVTNGVDRALRERIALAVNRERDDLRNVLVAALYNEPNGIDLVNRLTTYAMQQRLQAPKPQ